MKLRERKRVFNRTHIVKTFRITSDLADFLNSMGTSERAMFVCKSLHNFIGEQRKTISERKGFYEK